MICINCDKIVIEDKSAHFTLTNNLMSIPAASIARKKRNIASRDRSSLYLEPEPLLPILSYDPD